MTPKDFLSVVEQAWPDNPVGIASVEHLMSYYPEVSVEIDATGWLWLSVGGSKVNCWHPPGEASVWEFRAFLNGMKSGARELRWKALGGVA